MQMLKALSFTCLLPFILISCGPASEPPSKADEYLADAAAVQRGRSIFAGTCAAYCHKLTPGAGDALYLLTVNGNTEAGIKTFSTQYQTASRILG